MIMFKYYASFRLICIALSRIFTLCFPTIFLQGALFRVWCRLHRFCRQLQANQSVRHSKVGLAAFGLSWRHAFAYEKGELWRSANSLTRDSISSSCRLPWRLLPTITQLFNGISCVIKLARLYEASNRMLTEELHSWIILDCQNM